MAHGDIEARWLADRERGRRQHAERLAAGLCVKCGRVPAVPRAARRSQCEPCLEKDRAAGRARDARLGAASIPRRDAARTRNYERERQRHQREMRKAAGLCIRCGEAPAAPDRMSCEPCLEKRRAGGREKYAAGKAAGLKYGGADPEAKRRTARARSRRRRKMWREAGLCTGCGRPPAVEGGSICMSCLERRRAQGRRKYHARRAQGRCSKCGAPAFDGLAYCGPCAAARNARRPRERENEAARRKYAERKARGKCTSCGAPSPGAAQCAPCAAKARQRPAQFRGIPLWDPVWTVIERDTGREHGPFDSEADVALCLVFEKLGRDRVEVLCDASPMNSITSWT